MQTQAFEIWSEGFKLEDDSGTAHVIGKVTASTFLEACQVFVNKTGDNHHYRVANGVPVYWGCRLFDNEADARRSFG